MMCILLIMLLPRGIAVEHSEVKTNRSVFAGLMVGTVLLGVLGKILFVGSELGINVGLWMVLVAGSLLLIARIWRIPLQGGGRYLLIAALAFSVLFAWRDSRLLEALNLLCVLVTLGLGLPHLLSGQIRQGGVAFYGFSYIQAGLNGVLGWMFIPMYTPWSGLLSHRRGGQTLPVLRGVLLAIPVLLVFGGLLFSADVAFAKLISGLLDWNLGGLLAGVPRLIFWCGISAGLLYVALGGYKTLEPTSDISAFIRLGLTEASIVLGSVAVLFGAFIAVQFAYFFGGSAQVSQLTGLTYAEYARKGFFELVTVATLAAGMLLGIYRLLPAKEREGQVFRALALTIIGLVGVMLVSAWQRMMLYVSVYGLTEERLLTVVFMIWLALALVWFVLTVLRGRYNRFTFGALVLGLAVILLFNFFNPSQRIVQTNLSRESPLNTEDAVLLVNLGADGVPLLLTGLSNLPGHVQVVLKYALLNKWQSQTSWSGWNWSRARAHTLIETNKALLTEP